MIPFKRLSYLVAVGFVLSITGVAHAQNPTYGMNTHYLDGNLGSSMSTLGAGFVRVDFDWFRIETSQDVFDFSAKWGDVNEAESRGLQVFATLAYTPEWAGGGSQHNNPPYSIDDWIDFVTRTAQEFNGHITYWGIWNEPDATKYLSSPGYYPTLINTARNAIKSVNPGMYVLGPEVSSGGVVSGYYAWFMNNYSYLVDIVTIHYYNDGSSATKWVDNFMDTRVRPYLGGREVWMTETGRNYCDSAGQANHYQGVLERFEPRRSWWTKLFFYDLYEPDYCTDAILDPSYGIRPAFTTYQNWIITHP
jgi:hypothetical protein